MIRPDVVDALVYAVGELRGEGFGQLLDQATAEEIDAAVTRLRDAALNAGKPPDVLSATLWQLVRWAGQGRAFEHVAGLLPTWWSWPDQCLSSQLKVAPPHVVAAVRDALRRAGFQVDENRGEVDDHGLNGEP